MDIHSWLQTIADRQPPDGEEHAGIPDFLKPQARPEAKQRERHRTRKRPSSEPPPPSSERHHLHRKRLRAATWSSSSPDHARKLQPAATGSRGSSHASRHRHVREGTHEKRVHVPSESFERRARHRTRPDRYEAKPKQRSDGRKPRNEREPKSKGRKSRQNGDVAKATGMIRSFQLKNGRKDKRLTLRPDANAGIFKHGRSSAPVATNGSGLPDLVFNEMKFLQRPHEHQDEVPLNDAAPKQSKKSKQQLREEEISAYFVKKPLIEGNPPRKREDPQPDAVTYAVDRGTDQQPRSSSESDAIPAGDSINLPQRRSHESNTHDPTSYLTWSESAAVAQQLSPRESFLHAGEHTTNERPRDRSQYCLPTRDVRSRGLKQTRKLDIITTEEKSRWDENNRARPPRHFEIYVPAGNEQATTNRATDQSAASVAECLPHPCAKQVNSHSTELSRSDETREYRTSDILKIIDVGDDRVVEPPIQPRHQHLGEQQNRNSTPTSDLLRRAFDAVNNATANKPVQLARTKPIRQGKMESKHGQRQVDIYDTGYRPASAAYSSYAANMEEHAAAHPRGLSQAAEAKGAHQRQPLQPLSVSTTNAGPSLRPPSRSNLSMHKQHRKKDDMLDDIERDFGEPARAEESRQRRPYQPMSASTMNAGSQCRPPSRVDPVRTMHLTPLMEDDMPDDLQDAAQPWSSVPYACPHDRFAQPQQVDLDQQVPHERDQFYIDPPAKQLVPHSPRFGADLFSTGGPSSALHDAPLFNLLTDRVSGDPSSGENDEGQGPEDGMHGFWRPNVLY